MINRRSFLKAIGVAGLFPALPKALSGEVPKGLKVGGGSIGICEIRIAGNSFKPNDVIWITKDDKIVAEGIDQVSNYIGIAAAKCSPKDIDIEILVRRVA